MHFWSALAITFMVAAPIVPAVARVREDARDAAFDRHADDALAVVAP